MKVGQNGHEAAMLRSQGAHKRSAPHVVFGRAVRKVESNYVYAGLDQGLDHFRGVCGRAESSDYFGSALHGSDISFYGRSPGWWVV
ncbi:hypothetical protein D3C81_2084720 [compost metagenome]